MASDEQGTDGREYDVVVLGLGAFGAATLRALARLGLSAIGVDRFVPPHADGSSHGASRITRVAVGEGDSLVPLVRRSHQLWRELEQETGRSLFMENGALMIGNAGGRGVHHGRVDFVHRSIEIARRHGIPHEVLDAEGIGARFPQFGLRGDELAYFEPGGGLVRPEECIAAQLESAQRAGAVVRTGAQVRRVDAEPDRVVVATDRGTIVAKQAVSCVGAWTGGLFGAPWSDVLRVYRQTLFWFAPTDPAVMSPDRFPVFIWLHGERADDYFYGFPEIDGLDGVKVATEQYEITSDPDAVAPSATEDDARRIFDAHVAGRLPAVSSTWKKAVHCHYTATADSRFRIDRHPSAERVIVVSACSGHGFKHSAGTGEFLAQWCTSGQRPAELEPFALDAA